jgi:hypothetical protein
MSHESASRNDLRALQKSLAGGVIFKWIKQHLRYIGECGQDVNLDRGVGLSIGYDCSKKAESQRFSLHFATGFIGHAFRGNALAASISRRRLQFRKHTNQQPIESIRLLAGQQ